MDGEASGVGQAATSVGARLRDARTAAAIDLSDVATRTRIPIRHLEAIERSDYAALPSSTYALGFAKSYARAIGLDGDATVTALRAELGREPPSVTQAQAYQPVDPSRVPPRLLAWTAAALALAFAIGFGVWRSQWLSTPAPAPVATSVEGAPTIAARPAAQPVTGPVDEVVLTAREDVWLRVADAGGERLIERELLAGESFRVPPAARRPTITTGRPGAIAVTVNGSSVAPLGAGETRIENVEISAAALTNRGPMAQTPPSVTPSEN